MAKINLSEFNTEAKNLAKKHKDDIGAFLANNSKLQKLLGKLSRRVKAALQQQLAKQAKSRKTTEETLDFEDEFSTSSNKPRKKR